MTADDPDGELLARRMIEVHGIEAATVARENARGAALAARPVQAKGWISVLGIIQRHEAGKSSRSGGPGNPSPGPSERDSAKE